MLELNADNAADYVRSKNWIEPGPVRVETLSGGVSNVVLRVETETSRFILKQSRPQLRTKDLWFSDLNRIHREQEVMQALEGLLPDETVPRVLFVDRENYAFAMSHAPESTVWKAMLLAGEVDPAMGERTGRILGRMHQASVDHRSRFEAFRDRTAFEQLRIEPFYLRVQPRRPEVAAHLQPLIDGMRERNDALCHGDYTPKNMLVHASGFTLVDYETAHFGDPAMDLGLFLTHLLLKSIRRPEQRVGFEALIRAFWTVYGAEIRFTEIDELECRGVAHWGACLLARIDGASPVDYLDDMQRLRARQLGIILLRDKIATIDDVLVLARTP